MKEYQLIWSNTPDVRVQKGQIVSSITLVYSLPYKYTSLSSIIVRCPCQQFEVSNVSTLHQFGTRRDQNRKLQNILGSVSDRRLNVCLPLIIVNRYRV